MNQNKNTDTERPGLPAEATGSEFRYWEAVIVSRDNRGTLLEWHDGSRERLKGGIDWPLHWIADGRSIGVHVRLGPGDRVLEIKPVVTLLDAPNDEALRPPKGDVR